MCNRLLLAPTLPGPSFGPLCHKVELTDGSNKMHTQACQMSKRGRHKMNILGFLFCQLLD